MASNKQFRNTVAPNLPVAASQYSQQYSDEYSNVLRLYFNQIDNFTRLLTSSNGGTLISSPYFSSYQNGDTTLTGAMTNVSTTPIAVSSTELFSSSGFLLIGSEIIQYTAKTSSTFTGITRGVKGSTAAAHSIGDYVTEAAAVTAGTSAAAQIDVVSVSNDITCTVPDSKIFFGSNGIYNIQFSAQLLNFTTSEDNVTIWFRKNGSDIAYSAGIAEAPAKHGVYPGAAITGWNFMDSFNAGDYIELYWTSDSGNTILATYPKGTAPVHPVSPSLILTISFVSWG